MTAAAIGAHDSVLIESVCGFLGLAGCPRFIFCVDLSPYVRIPSASLPNSFLDIVE